jgi:hypothetical protein
MKKSLVSLNSIHLIRLAPVIALLFLTTISPLVFGVSAQQQNPGQPLTLPELNKMLCECVGRVRPEADAAAYVERFGIAAEFIIADRCQNHHFRNLIYFNSYRKFETDIKILGYTTLPLKKQ